MRFIVYGAGAIGGLAGARLIQAGHDTVLIARGAHRRAMADRGLTVESAEGSTVVPVTVAGDPVEAGMGPGDVVLLAVKSQDTAAALDALRRAAPADTPIVCLQNGVDNERAALRLFPRVHGVCVMCPASHLEPGVVLQHSVPVPGLFDIGRYPAGVDATAEQVAAAFREAGFESVARPDIMRWKYRKLMSNLGNSVQALCSPPGVGALADRARAEGERVLEAAGIDVASEEEDKGRRGDILQIADIPGRRYDGGSTWQSLQRATGSIESDFLNGEISLLGRLHGVPTPLNDLLQRLAWDAAARREPPGRIPAADLDSRVGPPS
jgi:2-dehydropantoate 2-reductase